MINEIGQVRKSWQRTYSDLHGKFGPEDPRSSGYQSVKAFEFESEFIHMVVSSHDGFLLDVGCGHGLVTAPLVAGRVPILGLDYNEAAVRAASNKGLLAVRGNAFSMPIKDATFDVVLSTEWLQELSRKNVPELFDEIARVLRRGGKAILIWRRGKSLLRRSITASLSAIDVLQGRPRHRLFNHDFDTVCRWAESSKLDLVDSWTISPLLRVAMRKTETFMGRLFGTSYVAVFNKR